MDTTYAEILRRVVDYSSSNSSDLIYFNGNFQGIDLGFVRTIRERSSPNLSAYLFIETPGGLPAEAYRIGRALQARYQKYVGIVVIGECKSSGTLLALAGNEIIMSDIAEFGPLDIQTEKRDELIGRDSGLVAIQAMESLKLETMEQFTKFFFDIQIRTFGRLTPKFAADIAQELAVGVMEPIYGQLDPFRIGENQRNLSVVERYAERLKTENVLDHSIKQLVYSYPSHDFIIDRKESRTLFKVVKDTTNDQYALASDCFAAINALRRAGVNWPPYGYVDTLFQKLDEAERQGQRDRGATDGTAVDTAASPRERTGSSEGNNTGAGVAPSASASARPSGNGHPINPKAVT